jgi:hypothetical protein
VTTDSAQLDESWINLTDVSEGFGAITPERHTPIRYYEMLMSAVSATAEIRRAESQVH